MSEILFALINGAIGGIVAFVLYCASKHIKSMAVKRKGKYAVKWGYSFEQKNLTKSEALKVAASLLRSYEIVLISKE